MTPRAWRAAAFLALTLGCTSLRREVADVPLRVATYNIQAGGGNLPAVVAAIRDLDAAIVGLQEVDVHWSQRSGFADQATEIALALGMHVRFAPIYRLPNADPSRPARQFGVAILSRYEVLEFTNESLTRLSTQDTTAGPVLMPGLAHAVVNVNGRRVRVFSTHLDFRADQRVRRQQVAEMLRIFHERPRLPTLVLGDLNAPPDASELQPLFGILRDVGRIVPDTIFTYPANRPTKRIDYVLASSEFRGGTATVVPSLAADHRPVVANLRTLTNGRGTP